MAIIIMDLPMPRQKINHPQVVIATFIAKRNFIGALIWGSIFGLTVVSSSLGYASAFATHAERTQAAVLGNNAGLQALLGPPHDLDTIAGFTAWRSLGLVLLVGAIWGILTATKTFRGEEETGRWETLLAGQTTSRRAVFQAFLGLSACILAMFAVVATASVFVGRLQNVQFSVHDSLFLALSLIISSAIFIGVGAFVSQFAATRRRASAWSAIIFGAMFVLRSVGDASSKLDWLGWFSPLRWIDRLQPLTDPHPEWLIPLATLIGTLIIVTIYLAGKRDLDTSLLPDRNTAPLRTALLGNSFLASWRLVRDSVWGWLIGVAIFCFIFGSVAPTAADSFSKSGALPQALSALTGGTSGVKAYLGFIFIMISLPMMLIAASQLYAVREEEARGFLDNLLVQPVSRSRWLIGRISISLAAFLAAGLIAGSAAWLGATSQHADIGISSLLMAGLNTVAPAILVFGIGIITFGLSPQFTAIIAYSTIAWSFLVELIGSFLKANHWLLDTSILHHIKPSPAVDPNWTANWTLVGIGFALTILGIWFFSKRDLISE